MAARQHNIERSTTNDRAPVKSLASHGPERPARAKTGHPSARPWKARARVTALPSQLPTPTTHVAVLQQPEAESVTGSPRILIVEDDAAAAGAIRAALELDGEPGWEIHVAGGGERALELASAAPPEVVLLDVALPDVDGAEVYKRLRNNPLTARARVLFVTGATSLDLHRRGIDGGVLLRKPFDMRALAGLVRTLLAA